MIPIGAIIAGAILAARYANSKQTSSTDKDGRPIIHSRRIFQGRSFSFLLVWLLVWPVWLALLWGNLFAEPNLVAAIIAVLLTPLCVPWPLVRFVAIPLGLPRLASALTVLADWTFGRDRRGGSVVVAVLAARAHKRPADLAWARQKLQQSELVGAGAVAAAALLAEVDDDSDDGAERLWRTLEHFDARVVPKLIAAMAVERRVVRALRVGDWRAVADLELTMNNGGTSMFARFARACARRVVSREPRTGFTDLKLRGLWLLAPRRRRTLPLLRATLARDGLLQPHETTAPTTTKTTTAATEALPQALALHVAATQKKDPTLAEVTALAAAWDPALKDAHRELSARARALGVHDVDAVTRGIDETVTQALCTLVEPLDLSSVDVARLPPLLQLAIDEVRAARLDALEIAATGLRQRVESLTDLAPLDELREFASVKDLAAAVVRTGDNGRALAWDGCQWTVCEIAVRLWNIRGEHRLANAMFRWLLDEATLLNDTRGIETQKANVKCGP